MYVARRVGHQKVSTTHAIYSHVEKTGELNLADVLEESLARGSTFTSKEFKEAEKAAAKLLKKIGD
jgi:hypothetical protein